MVSGDTLSRLNLAARDNSIDTDLAIEIVTRCLNEHLVQKVQLPKDAWREERARPDGLDVFISRLEDRTKRPWQQDDATRVRDLIDARIDSGIRMPIDLGSKLALIFNRPLVCSFCNRMPPDVDLHIDHIYPWSKGGSNALDNLQFLCRSCNLKKSNKVGYGAENV